MHMFVVVTSLKRKAHYSFLQLTHFAKYPCKVLVLGLLLSLCNSALRYSSNPDLVLCSRQVLNILYTSLSAMQSQTFFINSSYHALCTCQVQRSFFGLGPSFMTATPALKNWIAMTLINFWVSTSPHFFWFHCRKWPWRWSPHELIGKKLQESLNQSGQWY